MHYSQQLHQEYTRSIINLFYNQGNKKKKNLLMHGLATRRRIYCKHSANRLLSKILSKEKKITTKQQQIKASRRDLHKFCCRCNWWHSSRLEKDAVHLCFNPRLAGTREENVLCYVVISKVGMLILSWLAVLEHIFWHTHRCQIKCRRDQKQLTTKFRNYQKFL